MELIVRLTADGLLFAILLIAAPAILYSIRDRFWTTLPYIVMAGLTSLTIGKIMSLVYQPDVARPFLELGMTPGAAYIDNPGFPSDHALLATVTVVALYALTKYKALAVCLAILVVVMCIGRVLAFVHTPLDVVGGIVAGVCGAIWYKKLTK